MEKHAMIQEGVTPPEQRRSQGPLEDHLTRRAADRVARSRDDRDPAKPSSSPRGDAR